jgi:hypothetical protein
MSEVVGIWTQVAELAKRAALSPNLFRAIEAAKPVAWEDATLVVGLIAEDGQHAGVLNTSDFRLKVEAAIRQVTKVPGAKFRVIEGTSAEDWAQARERDRIAVQQASAAATRAASGSSASGSAAGWDGLYEELQSLWAEAEFRNFASGRGRFMQRAFDLIESALERLGEPANEVQEREFSRTIERVAGMISSDPAVIAFLLLDRRARKPI